MKKTLVSLAAASLIVTSAMAADKGIDIVTTGQAVLYYETASNNSTGDADLFDQSNSSANVGVQLNLAADLKNNFTFGTQLSYLGTAGLEKNLVSGVKQYTGTATGMTGLDDEIALTKMFIAKKIANTTVKIGRQELPKSLSPLAFSEGWNVFKNTFEAALVVNSDIPDTTLVGAYVGQSNDVTGASIATFSDLEVGGTAATVSGAAYMLTAQNKSLPMATITASYYDLAQLSVGKGATAIWGDVAVASKDLPLGLKLGLQGGTISPEASGLKATSAFGVKVGLTPIAPLYIQVAYSSVDDGTAAIKNTGTGVKTPLYTQMVYNQNSIARDANTFVIKGVYNTGDYGKIIAQYGMTQEDTAAIEGKVDYNELDIMYKVKAGGVSYFAGLIMRTWSETGSYLATNAGTDSDNRIRIWGRYAF